YQAHQKGRSATVLEILGENVRGIGPQVGAEILLELRAGQLGKVARQLLLGMAPGEVGVGLRKAALGQLVLDFGTGERLSQEDDLRVGGLDLADQPSPETQRLGMRVV